MRVSISLTVSLKDKPKDHLGITRESWTIGTDTEVGLSKAVACFIRAIAPMYGVCYDAETLNGELRDLARALPSMHFSEAK